MRRQQGQAIVLIAIMLTVLIGMAALAIDGSRAYAVRRDLQAAVDAAALAAADKLQQGGLYSSAEQAATSIFAANLRLYDTPGCSPAYGSALPVTITCNFADQTQLKQAVSGLGPQGSQFTLTASRPLQLQFARILTNGSSPTLAASSIGNVNNLRYTPAVGALNQAGCGGAAGVAITVAGGAALNINGDMVSNGAISVSSGSLRVAGDVYARCQSPVPGAVTTACFPSGASTPCSSPDIAGATRAGFRLVDPGYPAPAVTGGSQASPGISVLLSPGSYANPPITSGCYFLSGGVYRWNSGFTNSGGFVSNELKPPDEPNPGNNTVRASTQFWDTNGVRCAGAFQITISGGGGSPLGPYGVVLTSVRSDIYAGTSYTRESAPSMCRSFTATSFQNVTLTVSNVPGASSYNIYVSPTGCAGLFGLAGSLAVGGPVENDFTGACPFGVGCSLGSESLSVLALILPALPSPNPSVPPGTSGAYPPDSETAPVAAGLPNQNPPRGAGAAGDRANENNCKSTTGSYVTCPSPITPGAVEFYIPAGGCLSTTNTGDSYVFSGYQYNWVVVFEPTSNSCSNTFGAQGNSAYVGLVYTPAAFASITSAYAFEVAGTGGLIADRVTFSAVPGITYNSAYAPVPPAGRLTG